MGEKLYKIKKRAFPFCMCVAGYAILRMRADLPFLFIFQVRFWAFIFSYIKGVGLYNIKCFLSLVVEHYTCNVKVVGSIPTGSIGFRSSVG